MKEKKDAKTRESTMYRLMRMSEELEEDCLTAEDAMELFESEEKEDFKEKYKEFYTDIKISIKEDW